MIQDWVHGEKVFFSAKFLRGRKGTLKHWVIKEQAETLGLFLGTRTLYDGTVHWDGEAAYFSATRHFQVALISLDKKRNPIYVPFGYLRRTEWHKSEVSPTG